MMTDFLADFYDEAESPLDAYEGYLLTTETLFKRSAWDRMVMEHQGRFAKYRIEFHYLPDDERIVAKCYSEMMLDVEYEALAAPLILKINRGLSYGHFDMTVAGHPVFKHALNLRGVDERVAVEEMEIFRDQAVAAFDQRYPALSVMRNHMKRLADAGFVLEMDDFLPAVNDNPHEGGAQNLTLALMDVKGEG